MHDESVITPEDNYSVKSNEVHSVLGRKMLADGMPLVLDLENSNNLMLHDAVNDDDYIDFFSFFASSPLGLNHPKLYNNEFIRKIGTVALSKPSNSDVYTREMADFADTFYRTAVPDYFKHVFFIEGGALAVENGLKTAFDWKVRKNFMKGYKEEKGHGVIHFREAFHGRTGYTLSLTNTDPNKVEYFPKFNWSRVSNPKITFPVEENLGAIKVREDQTVNEIYAVINSHKDDIAVLIIEPVQAEGGDNFFRKEFHQKLRDICDENEILFMYDEVQTGIGLTGKMWAHEHYVKPDILAFGKKMQVCGIMVNDRIDDIPDNVFKKSGRINSTWGGNLTDMVRAARFLEIIEEENLLQNAEETGNYLLDNLYDLEEEFPVLVTQARGLGLMCAFDLPDKETRNKFVDELYKNKVIMLGCGEHSVRFRPPLNITKDMIDRGLIVIRDVLAGMK